MIGVFLVHYLPWLCSSMRVLVHTLYFSTGGGGIGNIWSVLQRRDHTSNTRSFRRRLCKPVQRCHSRQLEDASGGVLTLTLREWQRASARRLRGGEEAGRVDGAERAAFFWNSAQTAHYAAIWAVAELPLCYTTRLYIIDYARRCLHSIECSMFLGEWECSG